MVGTGGKNYTALGTRQPNSAVFDSGTFGVLRLEMYSDRYEWRFVPIAGSTSGFTDSGSSACHGAPTTTPPGDTTAPVVKAPNQSLPITRLGSSTIPVKVTWSATDDSGSIAAYEVQRSVDGGAFSSMPSPHRPPRRSPAADAWPHAPVPRARHRRCGEQQSLGDRAQLIAGGVSRVE